jgi:hypothetical protein
MPMYQFRLVRADGTTESNVRLRLADDDAAAERAAELLDASTSAMIEVWQGLHLVFSAVQKPEPRP